MPGLNGRGPAGNGPQTGLGRGRCVKGVVSDTDRSGELMGLGRGGRPFGCGMGRQAGMRNRRNQGFGNFTTTQGPTSQDKE